MPAAVSSNSSSTSNKVIAGPWFPISRRIAQTLSLAPGYTAEERAFVVERCEALAAFWRTAHPDVPLALQWFERGVMSEEGFAEAALEAAEIAPALVSAYLQRGHLQAERVELRPLYRQAVIVVGSVAA